MVQNELSFITRDRPNFTKMEETLGNVLRTARKNAGISVDDAVYLAKMPRSVVEALESEDFGFFSSPLYARSFLQQYGEYVGADVEPWLNDLEPTTMIDGEAVESFIDISEPVAAAVTREKPKTNSGGGAWAAVWMILITASLIWGGITFYGKYESRFASPVKTADTDEPSKDQPPADEPVEPAAEMEPVETPPEVVLETPTRTAVTGSPPRAIPVREE